MTKQVLQSDPLTGEVTTFDYDLHTNKAVITTTADVGSQIEDNKKEALESHHEIPGLGEKVAHIPTTVGMLWLTQFGVDVWSGDPDQRRAVMVLLNSPEWAFLRTNQWDLGTRQKTIYHGRHSRGN